MGEDWELFTKIISHLNCFWRNQGLSLSCTPAYRVYLIKQYLIYKCAKTIEQTHSCKLAKEYVNTTYKIHYQEDALKSVNNRIY